MAHKNIVGYKGCWVEAAEPDLARLRRISLKIKERRDRRCSVRMDEQIDEKSEDDSQLELI